MTTLRLVTMFFDTINQVVSISPQLSIERGKRAVEYLFQIHNVIPRLSQASTLEESKCRGPLEKPCCQFALI
jgi:hypothetical protein